MANETNFSASINITKSGMTISATGSKTVDMSDVEPLGTVQNVGTTTEQIDFNDVNSPGYLYLKNQDTTNFVQVGLATPVTSANAFAKLLPGEFCFVPTRQTVVYALADTATVPLQVVLAAL